MRIAAPAQGRACILPWSQVKLTDEDVKGFKKRCKIAHKLKEDEDDVLVETGTMESRGAMPRAGALRRVSLAAGRGALAARNVRNSIVAMHAMQQMALG